MANQVKKVEKAQDRVLHPGERVLGAAMIQPKGALKKQAIGGGLGGALGAVVAEKMVARSAGGTGLAAAMPAKRVVAALTDQRLLAIGLGALANGLKEVEASWARADVADIVRLQQGKLVDVLGVAFVDGSTIEVECVRAGNAASLLDAFAASRSVTAC